MRLFVAVRPPERVLDHLDLALAAVRGGPAGAASALRWTARENWHLTCAFYGDVPDGLVPALEAGLDAAAAGRSPWTMRLRGAGVFAHRTLWVGASGDLDAHLDLVEAVVDLGEAVGTREDRRERHRPHLTVGRVRPGAGPPRRRPSRPTAGGPDGRGRRDPRGEGGRGDVAAEAVRALAVYEGPAWTVEEVLLVQSRPGEGRGGGPLYTDVRAARLDGPA
ncbi:RNA 2',3'-cyclic phosphodiesterase [Cellulomonas endophytica]|uniref:RNA 2',3'-cyclic phosphodiesterase n=1 Tax=Cellulomonas endophytica TaxID=2494735 RepID=UPI001012BB0E|nr:RNA 2',3'-cyclic phosphodiesterase [Cellulomonas endophytica]